MKRLLQFLVPALLLTFWAPMSLQADEPRQAEPSSTQESMKVVRGNVLAIEGEFYVIKDVTGHEVRLHVNKDTKMDGLMTLKVGDMIEAHVNPDGHAQSISLRIPENGKGSGPQS